MGNTGSAEALGWVFSVSYTHLALILVVGNSIITAACILRHIRYESRHIGIAAHTLFIVSIETYETFLQMCIRDSSTPVWDGLSVRSADRR